MKLRICESKSIGEEIDIRDQIQKSRKLSPELKEQALACIGYSTKYNSGRVSNLELHPDLKKRIEEGGHASGFSMGIDENGYYIHTHRGRSKSKASLDEITPEEMEKTASTG